MASNLLIQSLLQGQNQMQDPAVAALAPKMQLAQALLQQGNDSSPTNRMGVFSRLAQALAGGYALNNVTGSFQDIGQQRQKDALAASNYMNGSGFGMPTQSAPTPPAQGATSAPAPTPSNGQSAPGTQPTLPAVVQNLESGGNMAPGQTGDGGLAHGPMQVHQAALDDVNAANGTHITLDQLTNDPLLGKQVGDRYLELQQQKFPGRPDLAMAAFNAGPGATGAAVASGAGVAGLPASTQQYVAKGMTALGNGAAPSVTPAPVDPQTPAATPQTGLNAPNIHNGLLAIQRAQQMMIANPYNPLIQKAAQAVIDNAHTIMGLDTVVQNKDGTQTRVNSGEQIAPAAPLAHFVQTPTGSHDTTGQHADTYMPTPRLTTTPAGAVVSVGPGGQSQTVAPADPAGAGALAGAKAGAEAAATGNWAPDTQNGVPGQRNMVTGEFKPTVTSAPRLMIAPAGNVLAAQPGSGTISTVTPADNQGVAARAAASAQGTETGKAAVATVGKMTGLGQEADTAIGNIDYGVNQLHQAAAGGINSGYFAPWLATAAAAGKSLGINTQAMGIDPRTVGNVQSAQKTLGVVAGAILQNAIGKDSAITDAKIEHFIHTQPGIETDPDAIQRVLGWARSQFQFNRNMAMDAMSNVNPDSGMIPPGWQASYYKRTGAFAPIYDPLSQEMKQPAGEGPAPAMPAVPAPATPAPPSPKTATHADGRKAVLINGQWVIQ